MKKLLLSAATLCFAIALQAQCTPQTTLNEDFQSFNTGTFAQNCWSSSETAPKTTLDQANGGTNRYVSVYSSMTSNVPMYVVSPEVITTEGNLKLSFDVFRQAGSAPGTVTVEAGTINGPADYASFTSLNAPYTLSDDSSVMNVENVMITEGSVNKYIVFKVVATANHIAIGLDNVAVEDMPATCEALTTLDENFNTFAQGVFPQNCWTSSNGAPIMTVDGNDDATENYVSVYSSSSANTAFYLVTPELSTIDGNHELSYDAYRQIASAPGNVTIEIGTLSNAADYSTFMPLEGSMITVNGTTPVTYDEITLPASTSQKYIAFKIMADAQHNAIVIDNVKWTPKAAGIADAIKNTFSIYPNPATSKIITIANNFTGSATVAVYSLTGAELYNAALTNNEQTVNLSNLSSGMYIVKVSTRNTSVSKKLIIK